ncbi:cytochrome C oxidase subunit IV family protein [Billgrantia montanilacus]|uniref:Cytochrome C oxidase subunit IV n=1 Tax=Billgrantia montanilacus TaxID=2282305 RepID=A0A368TP63_9GAMM|nr:cytochrome C oxidase subunit IV family protein [Halomonas montanilacus]RCV86340.1 cytochrome C oxidase subunit IV [Halomonas montanilacus]
MDQDSHQQPELRVYLRVWLWLFVLSVFSYLVDISGLEGLPKWGLITLFMLLKAGLIVAFFMHMAWERLSIIYTVLLPPAALLFLAVLMALEANYTLISRLSLFTS